jgi:DNA-directed RNA polymerase specialized sigma24 family protein
VVRSSPTSVPRPIPTALGRGVPNGLLADSAPRLAEEEWSSRSGSPVGKAPVAALEPEQKSGQRVLGAQESAAPGGLSGEAFAAALREQPKLRQALVARYGVDVGEQAVAAAMAWAWEHQDRLVGVTALRAYLFRVGQSSTRRSWVWASRNSASFPPEVADEDRSNVDDALDLADLLRQLPQKQRTCVLLIYAHGWPYRDVAELLEISVDAVNNHTHRGMTALRKLTKNAALEDQS